MQISSLFLQLPRFLSNLSSPTPQDPSGVTTFDGMSVKTTYELPPLPYAYNALEPHISEQIMKLHHDKHHQTYVNNLNAAIPAHVKALESGDVQAQIALQQVIKFNGGGHINHALFWQNLSPESDPSSDPSAAPTLVAAITKKYGSLDNFRAELKTLLLGLQGSGWGWLVKNANGDLELVTTKDQDPVASLGKKEAIFGIDMWEHAYYLQYLNDKATYFEGVWKIINWKVSEERYQGTAGALKL